MSYDVTLCELHGATVKSANEFVRLLVYLRKAQEVLSGQVGEAENALCKSRLVPDRYDYFHTR